MMLIFLFGISFFFFFFSFPFKDLSNFGYVLEFKFFSIYYYNFANHLFSFQLDQFNIFFFLTLLIVSFLVYSYSTYYLDFYNNFKMFFLLSSFIGSMVLLIFSFSSISFMVGWDYLGLTSICLIMFYPNKMTLYNSLLTMFFNRLSDIILILGLILLMKTLMLNFFLMKESFLIFLIFFFCSFVKSAQFPFSSWLPAAMAAPTPVSSLVHSSTLVTAGVFLIFKILDSCPHFICTLNLFGSSTFLMGGLLAFFEKDLKKMVAFSTMSQISMMIFFLSTGSFMIAYFHITSHALFKSCLFCCSGAYFVSLYWSQLMSSFSFFKDNKFVSVMFFLSIFSMIGFYNSASFGSKDVCINKLWESSLDFLYFILILGSIMTIFYSVKMMRNLNFSYVLNFSFLNKMFPVMSFFLPALIFCYFSLFSKFFGLEVSLNLTIPFLPFDLYFFNLIFFMSLFMYMNLFFKFFMILPIEVMFMKFFSFSIFGLSSVNFYFRNDMFFFKPWFFYNFIKSNFSKLSYVVLFYSFYSFSLIRT